MPVDVRPFLLALLMFIVPVALLLARKIKTALILAICEMAIVVVYTNMQSEPPKNLIRPAEAGTAKAQFELSRWYRAKTVAGQGAADLDKSYQWLLAAAKQNYPPALYTLGVLYKMGIYVPDKPGEWQVRVANPRPDIAAGQRYIDEALRLGFKPTVREDLFYNTVYCVPSIPIPSAKTTSVTMQGT